MRVTNSMLVSNFMNNLNTNLTKLDKLQSQLATNRKFAHISDDPVAVIYSQQARQKLNRLSVYQDNVGDAQSWLTQAETSLLEINSLIKSAYEACVDAATDVKSETDKEKAAQYIGQLRDQMLHTLNSAYGTKFIYGGFNTTGYIDNNQVVAPFTLKTVTETVQQRDERGDLMFDMTDPSNPVPIMTTVEKQKLCYNGCDLTDMSADNLEYMELLRGDVLEFDVGAGIRMPVTINGIDVATFTIKGSGSTPDRTVNLFELIDDLYNTVNSGHSAEYIGQHISGLQAAQDYTLAMAAEIGGRTNRLDILSSRYEQDEINYTQMKSDAEDVDQAEVIMNYKMAEAVYKAALSTGAYIIQPTLMDFLR